MTHRIALSVTLALLLCPRFAVSAEEDLPPATRWIPENALIVLEISRPDALFELLFGEDMTATVTALPAWQAQESRKEFRDFRGLMTLLEASIATDWRSGLSALSSGGITFAACPEDEAVLIIDGRDEQMLGRLHEFLANITRAQAAQERRPDRVESREYRGVTGWTFDGKEAHAIIGTRLVLTSNKNALKAVLDRRAEAAGDSLATIPAYQAARQTAGSDAAATLYVDLERLKRVPRIRRALEENRRNPLRALFFSGITEALRESTWLAAALHVENGSLVLQTRLNGALADPAGPAAFALPSGPEAGAMPNLAVPHRLAALSLYRDLARFYAAKDDLFPERTSELVFFENMMGIFFTGRDLTDEVMSQALPDIRLVVAEQEYDPAIGTPVVQLPAFAVIFRLEQPEEFAEVAQEAWQKALGLINFTRGQQALPGLIIDHTDHQDTRITVARFSASGIEDRSALHERFNFRPALAVAGSYLILSSTEGLTRDLLDALVRESAEPIAPLAGVDSLIDLDGSQLASILESNHATLVRQNMIEKGNSAEEAEAAIGALVAFVRLLDRVELSAGTSQGVTEIRIATRLNFQSPPAPAR